MNEWAQGEGQPGLGYIFWRERRGRRRWAVGQEHRRRAHQRDSPNQLGLGVGDAVFFIAGKPQTFVKFAGPARDQGRRRAGLID